MKRVTSCTRNPATGRSGPSGARVTTPRAPLRSKTSSARTANMCASSKRSGCPSGHVEDNSKMMSPSTSELAPSSDSADAFASGSVLRTSWNALNRSSISSSTKLGSSTTAIVVNGRRGPAALFVQQRVGQDRNASDSLLLLGFKDGFHVEVAGLDSGAKNRVPGQLVEPRRTIEKGCARIAGLG